MGKKSGNDSGIIQQISGQEFEVQNWFTCISISTLLRMALQVTCADSIPLLHYYFKSVNFYVFRELITFSIYDHI